MTSPPEDAPIPISEDDRETAVQRLQDAYAAGHISHEDMDGRLDLALTARTHSELVPALASLPAESPATTSTIAAAGDGSIGAAHGGYLGSSRSSPRSAGCT